MIRMPIKSYSLASKSDSNNTYEDQKEKGIEKIEHDIIKFY